MSENASLAERIRISERTSNPVDETLSTDEQVLARITDGIYRQPASALRELISNAYDADATEVVILTDAPRFSEITIRDDGQGLTPEVMEHLLKHIGGSAKRTKEGQELRISSSSDVTRSPSGRQLIGKLGIGLFSVAQFTRHFLIITKTKGDSYRTIADITLGPVAGQNPAESDSNGKFTTGEARIWRELAEDSESHGTEIKLLDLLPRTKAELSSEDIWARIEFESDDSTAPPTQPPIIHIGRINKLDPDNLLVEPQIPWQLSDAKSDRFSKFTSKLLDLSKSVFENVDLDIVCDRYFQTIWNLAVSAPLPYVQKHPFDLQVKDEVLFYLLENSTKGQAKRLDLENTETPRSALGLTTVNGSAPLPFSVFVDDLELTRPVLLLGLPKTSTAVQTPLLFSGIVKEDFVGRPLELSGGALHFEAYLYWAPKVIPRQNQGVNLRVGNASGSLFDRTFMGYQTSEQTRTRQIIAEVFVSKGLDGAINIDRESFNYAHPHYQYITRWLHSALRQLANRHKELGSSLRKEKLGQQGEAARAKVDERVRESLSSRGVQDIPKVTLTQSSEEASFLRQLGTIALVREKVIPSTRHTYSTTAESERRKNAESKAIAITQLLHGWGLLDRLSFEDQQKLVKDIIEIVMVDQ